MRCCHSPWVGINQTTLLVVRGVIALYLAISFFLIVDYEIMRNDHGWVTIFELSNISYLLQLIYQLIAFVSSLASLVLFKPTSATMEFGSLAFKLGCSQCNRSGLSGIFTILLTLANLHHNQLAFKNSSRPLASNPPTITGSTSASSILLLSHIPSW